MIGRRRPACARHRAVLLDLVDRQEPSPATDDALAHLDRCRACEAELVEVSLTSLALRRLWVDARAVQPPEQAWPAVRNRLGRPAAPAWRTRVPMAGLVVGAALVALVLGPSLAWTWPVTTFEEVGTNPVLLVQRARERRAADRLAEIRFIMAQRAGPPGSSPSDLRGVAPRPDPDRARDTSQPATAPDPAPPVIRAE